MIPLMVALPLLSAFLLVVLDTLRAKSGFIRALFLIGVVSPVPVFLLNASGTEVVGGWRRVAGIEVGLTGVNTPLITGELLLFTAVAVYSLSYFEGRKAPKALALLLLMHAGLLGAFIARDLFNFYIYMEIASVSAFALVAFSGEDGSKEAAFKYLVLSLLASYTFVFSVGLIYMETGYLNVGLIAESASPSRELNAAVAMAFASLLLKAGIFPLHGWLPDAHSKAPTPVSALLSGLVVKAPAYGMMLLFSALPVWEGFRTAVIIVAASSVFFGIVMALLQRDAKRLLAYHTVSQMGYVLLGIATLNFVGAAYYAMAHSIFKGGLFLSVGSLGTETRELGKFGYRNAPLMGLSVLMLSLAIGGVSPFIGAYGKGLIAFGLPPEWAWIIPAGTVGTLTSFTKLNYHLVKGQSGAVRRTWEVCSLFLALLTLGLGLYLGARLNPKDAVFLLSALVVFYLLKGFGVLGARFEKRPLEVGREVNVLTAVFVLFLLLAYLLQGP